MSEIGECSTDDTHWCSVHQMEKLWTEPIDGRICAVGQMVAQRQAVLDLLDLLLYAWRTPNAGGVGYEDLVNVRNVLE